MLGFGCWQIGGPTRSGDRETGWGPQDDEQSREALRATLAGGIRFFDTAAAYGWGHSENLLGETLREFPQADVAVCTKFGVVRKADGSVVSDFSQESLNQSVAASLKRLRRQRIDVLLLHSPPDDFPWDRYDRAPLERLQSSGLIGAYGVSVKTLKGAERVLDAGFGQYLEAVFNCLDRRAAESVLPRCLHAGVRFIARTPLASGFLAGHLNAATQLPANDHRSALAAAEFSWRSEAARQLAFLDELPGGRVVSALRYALFTPGAHAVIPGMRRRGHVEQALMAWDLGALPESVRERMQRAVPEVYPGWR